MQAVERVENAMLEKRAISSDLAQRTRRESETDRALLNVDRRISQTQTTILRTRRRTFSTEDESASPTRNGTLTVHDLVTKTNRLDDDDDDVRRAVEDLREAQNRLERSRRNGNCVGRSSNDRYRHGLVRRHPFDATVRRQPVVPASPVRPRNLPTDVSSIAHDLDDDDDEFARRAARHIRAAEDTCRRRVSVDRGVDEDEDDDASTIVAASKSIVREGQRRALRRIARTLEARRARVLATCGAVRVRRPRAHRPRALPTRRVREDDIDVVRSSIGRNDATARSTRDRLLADRGLCTRIAGDRAADAREARNGRADRTFRSRRRRVGDGLACVCEFHAIPSPIRSDAQRDRAEAQAIVAAYFLDVGHVRRRTNVVCRRRRLSKSVDTIRVTSGVCAMEGMVWNKSQFKGTIDASSMVIRRLPVPFFFFVFFFFSSS